MLEFKYIDRGLLSLAVFTLCDFDVIISPSIGQVQLSSIGPLKLGFLYSVYLVKFETS